MNGKIAKANGDVAWLDEIPNPEGTDYGYTEFLKRIDTTIQGYSTYAQVEGWDIEFPYKELKNYVVTTSHGRVGNGYVDFIVGNPINAIEELKSQEGKDIWLIGGGKLNGTLLQAGLIDEIILFQMPIVLENGIDIFEGLDEYHMLPTPEVVTHPAGVIELRYHLRAEGDEY